RPLLRSGVPAREWRLDPEAVPACHALAAEVDRLLAGTGRRVERLWSSDEPKAVATAEALAHAWGLEGVSRHPGLAEHRRGPLPLVGAVEWRGQVAALFTRRGELGPGEEAGHQAREGFAAAGAGATAEGAGSP